jgi:hypothetical protein
MPVGISGNPVMVVAGMGCGQQVLAAVFDPAHRIPELQRQCRQDNLLGIKPRLGPEPAADIGGDHPDCPFVDAEGLGDRDPHRVRHLSRGPDHDLVEPVVAVGKDRSPFERHTRLPVHPVLARYRDFGRARGALDVAAFEAALEVEVVAPLLVDQGRAAAHVAQRVDHGVEHLVIDGNQCCEVFGLAASRCDAGGDRFADIARLIGGQRRPGRRFRARRLSDNADRLDLRQVRRGKDAALALGWRRDPANPGMRMRAADEGHLHRAGEFDVRHEFAAAMQVALVLAAQQRGANSPSVIRHQAPSQPAPPLPRRSRRRCWYSRCSGRCCRRDRRGSRARSRPARVGSSRAR